nr:putative reverse transcriptase, RNA-dependent DNA polymerase [Tanacetum cinerariifolium]
MLGMHEEEATDFALMAFTSNPSSSSSSNSEREKLSKANLEIIGYQYGLESIEGQLRVHQQNEVIYKENIAVLEYEVKDKSNLLKYTQKQLDEALREKEDLKSKLENFETSLKNLNKLLYSQISAKVKTGLGYDSQFHEKEVLDIREEEVTETVFDISLKPERIPAKIDFMKASKSVKHVKHVDSVKHVNPVKSVKTIEQTKKSKHFSSSPKIDRKDWNGKMTQKLGLGFGFTKKACFVCGSMSHLIKDYTFHEDRMAKKLVLPTNVGKGTGHRECRPFWNNVQRRNHQNKFAPTVVFTRSGRTPVSVAKLKVTASTSTAKPVNIDGPKQSVNFSKSRSTFHKSHSPIRRSFYNATAHSRRNSTKRINTVGSEAVSVVKGNGVTAVKTLAGCDSGCSRHMTGNKAYHTDYQEINDGGFVAFGLSRASIDESNVWHRRLDHVNFKTMNKLVKGNLVRGFLSKIFEMTILVLLVKKDETSKVLKPFISAIENQINNKVKVIRCDNGIEFKNKDLDELCGLNGIKRKANQHYIVLPLWSSISSTFKSSDNKATDDKPTDDTGSKTVKEPINKEDQAYIDEFNRLMSQEKEASDVADALRRKFKQGCIDQRGVTNSSSTTSFNTVSHPVNATSTSGTFSAAKPSYPHPDAFIPANTLLHVDQHDSQIPYLEDTVELQSTGIFNIAYNDDLDIFDSPVQSVGAEAEFNNMESSTVMEPKKVFQDLDDASWVEAMQEEFLQFSLQKGIVVRNKARLVAQGHRQEELIDYDEVFAPVARIEAIRIFLAFASYMGFIVYQIDVKSAFLYGTIKEEVYVCQPPGFIDPQFPNKVYKVENALYRLHQAPRAWYLKGQPKLGLWYPRDSPFDLEAYSDTDYAGVNLDRKSTIGEYVAATNCCGQVLWIQNQMLDYGFNFMNTKIYIDNESIIRIVKNPVYHSKTKHIEIMHYFIRDSYEKKLIQVLKIHTDDNVADLLTKAFDVSRLKLRVKRLEKKRKDRTLQPMKRRLFKGRVKTSTDKSVGEDASKQGRNDDKTEELNLTDGADIEVLVKYKGSGEKGGSTARPEVSTTTPSTPPITTTIFGDEDLTIAQALIKLRSEKAKEKGVAFRDVEEPPRLTRSTITLQPLPTIDPKDKGKCVLVEEEPEKLEKVKRRDKGLAQIKSDAELAQRIYEEELAELDRAQKERQKQEEATIAALTEEFGEIQTRMDTDHELAVIMTHEEQEKYTIKERARLLAEYFKKKKKQLAAERAEAIRNKPPTRTQVRNRMITYLKHMGKYTHQQLKHKTFKELQKLYQKEQKWKDVFVPMDLKRKKEIKQESAKSDEEESANYEHEKEELRMWLTVVSDEEETIDPEILSTKEKVSSHQGNDEEDVELEARS